MNHSVGALVMIYHLRPYDPVAGTLYGFLAALFPAPIPFQSLCVSLAGMTRMVLKRWDEIMRKRRACRLVVPKYLDVIIMVRDWWSFGSEASWNRVLSWSAT